MPLVSVIMPAYNSAQFIRESINSVLTQTLDDWELIVVDDASVDDTPHVLDSFVDSRIQILTQQRNQGAGVARQRALDQAQGRYIAFLDSDDTWEPHKLETQVAALQENHASVCCSAYQQMDAEGKHIGSIIPPRQITYEKLLTKNYIGNLTGMYDTVTIGKIDIPELRKRQDYAMWLQVLKASNKPAIGTQETLACYRVHEAGISANKWKLLKYNFQVYYQALGMNAMQSLYRTGVFLWTHFTKR